MPTMQLFIPLESELLMPEEIEKITGRARRDQQIIWLIGNNWRFTKNAAGAPIVGRLYARLKLSGIDLSATSLLVGAPDFTAVR